MPESQTTTPSDTALSISAPIGVLDTEVAESSPPSSSGAPETVAEVSVAGDRNDYVPRFVDDVHDYIREHIRNADRKAVFFFGSTTAVLAFLYSVEASNRWLKPLQTWNCVDAVTFLGMVSIAAAALAAAWTVVPRLPGSNRGLLYFNAVAQHGSAAEYAGRVLGTTQQVLVNEKAKHCYVLAGVCRAKYRWLGVSLWLSIVGLACTFVFFLLDQSTP